MAADHRPLDTYEFISHFEEMPSQVPEERRGAKEERRAQLGMVYAEFRRYSQLSRERISPQTYLNKASRPVAASVCSRSLVEKTMW